MSDAADRADVPTIIIQPPRKWAGLDLKALWEHRELFWVFGGRDLKVRYKQTELGVAWAVLQPFFTMVVFTLVFGQLAGLNTTTGGIPYPLFTFAAIVPWNYFSLTLNRASVSLVEGAAIVTKVYFPRLLLPLSSLVSGIVDFGIAFLILIAMMVFYGFVPGWGVLALPLLVVLASASAIGVGLLLGAIMVEYRDVRYITPFLTQVWMYLSPVIYPLNQVPGKWKVLYSLNPMVGIVEGFRWALLRNTPFPSMPLALSVAVSSVVLVAGFFYFRRTERIFADVV